MTTTPPAETPLVESRRVALAQYGITLFGTELLERMSQPDFDSLLADSKELHAAREFAASLQAQAEAAQSKASQELRNLGEWIEERAEKL